MINFLKTAPGSVIVSIVFLICLIVASLLIFPAVTTVTLLTVFTIASLIRVGIYLCGEDY